MSSNLLRTLTHLFGLTKVTHLRSNITLYDMPSKRHAKQLGRTRKYGERLGSTSDMASKLKAEAKEKTVYLCGKRRKVMMSATVVMLQTLRCPIRVVFVYRHTQWVALFTTDLSLSIKQIIEFYGARWKIESGFKELKQDIGSSRSQTRNAYAVKNHLNFCMMAAAVTWLYAIKLSNTPERRHMVRGRNSFAFSDVRYILAKAALSKGFDKVCPKHGKPRKKLSIPMLLRMFA